jgi:hypothetical protein
MSSINGIPGAAASAALNGAQETTSTSATGAAVKINYGDPARAAGLQNMLGKLQQLTAHAQAVVQARNATLQ